MTRHLGDISREERAAGNADGNKLANLGANIYDSHDVVRAALLQMVERERQHAEAIEACERLDRADLAMSSDQKALDIAKIAHLPADHSMPARFIDHDAIIKTAMAGIDDAVFVATAALRNVQQAIETARAPLSSVIDTVARRSLLCQPREAEIETLLTQILSETTIPEPIVARARALREGSPVNHQHSGEENG